jgi:hypothetical protein
MNRQLKSASTLCLLLALAACAKTGRHSGTQPDPATKSAQLLATPSRAELLRTAGDRLQHEGRCHDALPIYGLAALEPGPARSQTLAAIYLCHWELQRPKAAQESFMLFLRHELDQGRLPLKLLFQPGEVRYLAHPGVSAPYETWLRRIADVMLSSQSCLVLHGHASPSAVEQYSPGLALRRAELVQRQLETLAPGLKGRLKSLATENGDPLIGSASDDLRDALDRRVEFSVIDC